MSEDQPYDSTDDTLEHINTVQTLMEQFSRSLNARANRHDDSKFEEPEKAYFDEFTPKLKDTTYGSPEYQKNMAGMQPGLDHHYAANSHHPEHYPDGINGMNLLDIVEMFLDWVAATKRHADGDIHRSIDYNEGRFAYSSQISRIFHNTAYANPHISKFTGREERPSDPKFTAEVFADGMRRMPDRITKEEAENCRAAVLRLSGELKFVIMDGEEVRKKLPDNHVSITMDRQSRDSVIMGGLLAVLTQAYLPDDKITMEENGISYTASVSTVLELIKGVAVNGG